MKQKEWIGKTVEFRTVAQIISGVVIAYDAATDVVTMRKGEIEFGFNLWLARSVRIID
ncbi:hypothetical protein LCGC14_2757670 [marine sediment metagenome]|uniref:Uncharacterized protein n=1 Tax=marine sediment metagenome TaxID=412755 RepID=A0A0F9B8H9_9ZZZZ